MIYCLIVPSSLKQTKSIGKYNWHLFFVISFKILTIWESYTLSNFDEPSSYPKCFKNGNDIAPPIIIFYAFFDKFFIKSILSETFAPPKTTVKFSS